MFASFGKFFELYGTKITPKDFNRLVWEADRILYRNTTGADGVRKLDVAFPTDDYAAECVKRCECELVSRLYDLEQAQKAAQTAQSFITRDDGTVARRAVASVSSGSESISYAQTSGTDMISAAASSAEQRNALLREAVTEHLSGIKDANGVNLLYMGRYPHVR